VQLEACIRQYGLHTGFIEDLHYRQQAESWQAAADYMVQEPEATQHFLSVLRKAQKGLLRDKDIVITLEHIAHPLLEHLQAHQLLTILLADKHTTTCLIPGGDCRAFLSGDWLKIYLWRQLTGSGNYEEVRWGVRLIIHAQMEYELDVLCLRDGELYLYECNTMADPVARSNVYLDLFQTYQRIFSETPLHSHFVCIHPHITTLAGYDALEARAQQQGVTIIAGHALREVVTI
jgi:Domain of unknown function (DUF1887).